MELHDVEEAFPTCRVESFMMAALAISQKDLQLPKDLASRPRVSAPKPTGVDLPAWFHLRQAQALWHQEELPLHQPMQSPIALISAKCTKLSPHYGASAWGEDGAPDSLPLKR